MKSRDGSGTRWFAPVALGPSRKLARRVAFVLRGLLVALVLELGGANALGQLRISEFMASNTRTLKDEDGAYEDWIELQNTTATNVDVGGWFLTDAAGKPTKWMLPSTNIRSGGFLVVFASGKDRRVPGQTLHTNFKLDAAGDYLALVAPDGLRRVTEFTPQYPPQFPDVAFGLGTQVNPVTLVATNAPVRYLVPTGPLADDSWRDNDFPDASWRSGVNGLGYDAGAVDPLEQSYAGRVLQTVPALYWRLDETNGTDALNLGALGGPANGTYNGGIGLGGAGPRPPAFTGFEPENRAPQCNGSDAFVGGPRGLLDNVSQFTLAGWIRPTGPQGGRTGLFGQNDAIEFGFIDAGTLQLWTPVNAINVAYPFAVNQWHHVVALGDANRVAIYLDGVLAVASTGDVGVYPGSGYPFNAGGGGVFDAAGNPFLGQLDEVAVWTRALSDAEIQSLLAGDATSGVDFGPAIATDVRTLMEARNASVLVRAPFTVPDPALLEALRLRVRYDDGFVAFLNGVELARRNAPTSLAWNATATVRHPDNQALQYEEIDVNFARGFLQPGLNVLALHGLNLAATNTDFLLQAGLDAVEHGAVGDGFRYLVVPTPGAVNGTGTTDLGPIILGATHAPTIPQPGESLLVTARVAPAFSPIASVMLRTRVMFGAVTSLAMNDAGVDGDAVAGDGIWSARIPAARATAGQMIRYAISASDAQRHTSSFPPFPNPADSEEYHGTVVADPSIASQLPVVHVFVENTGALDGGTPTRGAVFYSGELYDNVRFEIHGQSSSGWPKKGYNIDFNRDHRFRYAPEGVRQKDITLMSPYGDKTRMHTALSYTTIAEAGGAGHFCFPIRVQRNGAFFGIESLLENGDDHWLERLGRDPEGALYKMYNDLSSAGGNEKKTRTREGSADLQALVTGLSPAKPIADRVRYAWDNLDLPQVVSYFATLALVSSQDHGHKNYYLYRDSDGTGEWAIFPWDVDLTWGRNWIDRLGYFSDILHQTNSLTFYDATQQGKPANRLYELVYDHPAFRRMYLRRLRTLMDTLLMPAGTAPAALRLEPRIRAYADQMSPAGVANSDGELDRLLWGPNWGNVANRELRVEAERTISEHLAGRRSFLFNSPLAAVRGERIPDAQPADAAMAIAGVEFNPASGNQDEEYVQLTNTNAFAFDLSGWLLGGAVQFTFRPGTVVPAGASLYVTPSVKAFRARATGPRAGQSLFVQGNYHGQLSAWGETVVLADPAGRPVAGLTYTGNPSPAQRFLRITELMYNPAPAAGDAVDAQQYEFIELRNVATDVTLDLRGVCFVEGVQFCFTGSAVTQLPPGGRVLLVRNAAAFRARYGTEPGPIAGEYTGALDNSGDNLRLEDAVGEKILEFAYDNRWYPTTDGQGFALVIADDRGAWESWTSATSWHAGSRAGGSPGQDEPPGPAADTDGDGMPDGWEQAQGLNPGTDDAAADPDRDGLTNLQEYWAGTAPLNPASVLRFATVERGADDEIRLSFTVPADRTYRVEYRDLNGAPGWFVLTTIPAAGGERTMTLSDRPGPDAVRLYRLAVPSTEP